MFLPSKHLLSAFYKTLPSKNPSKDLVLTENPYSTSCPKNDPKSTQQSAPGTCPEGTFVSQGSCCEVPPSAEGPYQTRPPSPRKCFKNVLGARLEGMFECKARLENAENQFVRIDLRESPQFACESPGQLSTRLFLSAEWLLSSPARIGRRELLLPSPNNALPKGNRSPTGVPGCPWAS